MRALSTVPAALIVLSSMLAPAPAQAAKSADLVVSSVTGATSPATTGKPFTLKAKVRNAGKKSAKASTARVYLGWDDKLDLGKAELLGQFKVPSLDGGKSKTLKPKLTIPLDAPVGRAYYLVVCADDAKKVKESSESNNCKAASDQITLQGAPTVLGQIDEDVASGEIDEATGLLYYAYTATGDPRLPDSYGPVEQVFDSPLALWKVADRFGSQSAASQAALDPFFSPPSYVGGYIPPAAGSRQRAQRRAALGPGTPSCTPGGTQRPASSGWASIPTTHFRIWYFTTNPGGLAGEASTPAQSQAGATALSLIAENVYEKEDALWRAPLSDAGTPCNGGDGLIDVYSSRLSYSAKAQVIPHPPGSNLRPGWMWVAPDALTSEAKTRSYFAHEFAHLTQLAYNESANPAHGTRIEYGWLEEASATWAMDYVYPTDNLEHEFASSYYDSRSWQISLGECEYFGCGNGYKDYLFFFFLTHKLGNTGVMSALWDNVESYDSIAAVKNAVPGSFATEWRNFALYDMNRENYKQYTTWDGIPDQLPLADDGPVFPVSQGGVQKKTTPYPHAAEGGETLEAKGFGWVSFHFGDNRVRKFTIKDFGFQSASSDNKVTAWYKLANGQTGILDLTGETQHSWCRDEEEQDLTELIVFYTDGRPTPLVSQAANSRYPKASGEVVAEDECGLPETFTGTFAGNLKEALAQDTWSGSVSLEFDIIYNGDPDDLVAYYRVSGGDVTWTQNEFTNSVDCEYSPESPQTGALSTDPQGDGLYLYIDRDPVEYELKVGNTAVLPPMPYQLSCPGAPPANGVVYPSWGWNAYTYEYETSPYTTNDTFNIADSFDDDEEHLEWTLTPGSLND